MEWFSLIFKIIGEIIGFFIDRMPHHTDKKKQPDVPKQTLKIITMPYRSWWHMGGIDNHPAMQIVSRLSITNLTNLNIKIISAWLKKPKVQCPVILPGRKHDIIGPYLIGEGEVIFWVTPPIKRENQTFKADIAFVDQFGNKNWVKGVEFAYR